MEVFQLKIISLLGSGIRPIKVLVLRHFYELSLIFSEEQTKEIFIGYYDDFFDEFPRTGAGGEERLKGGVTRAVPGERGTVSVLELLRQLGQSQRLLQSQNPELLRSHSAHHQAGWA